MRYVWIFIVVVLLLLGGIYGLLFTAPGNNLLKPTIESKIAANVPLPTKLETFVLRPNRFEFVLKIGKDTFIQAKGNMNLLAQSIDGEYHVDIKELSNLKKLIGTKLNGPFNTDGTIKGDKSNIHINGKSDVALSQTTYALSLKDFKPADLIANIAHLHIDKALYMVNQPEYAQGLVDVNAKIKNLDLEHLDGIVLTTISKGLVHPQPVKKDFNLSIPSNLTFKGNIHTDLKDTKAISNAVITTSIATLKSKAVTYDIKEGSLDTDYRLSVPNLDRLYFVTNQHMKGHIAITGNIKTAKNLVQATAHSDTLGGAFDALYKNGKAKVNIKNIQTVALSDMLLYPHVFDSKANATLNYDTVLQSGKLHAELLNGQILPNKMSTMLNQLAHFDITKEIYERTTLDSKIMKKVIHSDLYMKSRLTEISSKNGMIDLNDQTIDTTLNIKMRKMMLPVILKGALTSPKIKIDAKSIFKSKLKSKAKETIEKRLPKSLKNSPAGNLLKGLF